MESSTTSFKDDKKPAPDHTTRGIGYPPEVYPPSPYYGGGYPPEVYPPPPHYGSRYPPEMYPPPPHYGGGYPPAGYAPPQSMHGYGGHPSPPPSYGAYPLPYNTGPYAPQAYVLPHHAPPVHGYAPPPGYPPAENVPTKNKKKSKFGKMLGLGAGLVGGGLLLGDLAPDSGVAAPSFESSSDPTGGGFDQLFDASMQSISDSMDLFGTIFG